MKISLFSICLGLAAATLPSATAAENLALGRDYVSSAPNGHGWDKPGLTDGRFGTDNRTCYATNEAAEFPKHVTVDLGEPRTFRTVVVGVPPFGSTKTVEVSVSADNQAFRPLGKVSFKQGEAQREVVKAPSTEARYVRLTYPDHHEAERGFPKTFAFTSEVEVYDGDPPPPPDPALAAVTPEIKDRPMHDMFLERIREGGPVDLLFLGDSITDWWSRRGEGSWLKFAPYRPANFGIAGDRTEHLLWRITNGELEGIQPRVVVIMIGTNNVRRDEPAWTAAGVAKIVETVREKLPKAKILLLAVFPRDRHDSSSRQRNDEVNRLIKQLADDKTVHFLDVGKAFLDANGDIPGDVMPDALHPNAKGYEIWYQAMKPKLDALMR